MSTDRERELEAEVANLTNLVVDLLTGDHGEDEAPEPDPEYDQALDRTNVLRPILVEAHAVIADREGATYGADELGMCLHWVDCGVLSRVVGRSKGEQEEVAADACARVGKLLATLQQLQTWIGERP